MDMANAQLDLLTQRFVVNRWKTPIGREIRDKIIECAKTGGELDDVLKPHVLEHPSNIEPYDYPYYPPDAMESKDFWLLTHNDLRGIHFFGEDFATTMVFARKNLGYATFSECDLSGADLEMADFCYANFERCDLTNAIFAYVTACCSGFIECNLIGTCFLGCQFKYIDFSGSDLRDVYFEDNELEHLVVNYQTKIRKNLQASWHQRDVPEKQLADVYRAIRIAYQKAELFNIADHFQMQERAANRKYILWGHVKERKTPYDLIMWFRDLVWSLVAGYGTKPQRTILTGLFMSAIYAAIYYFTGGPPEARGRAADLLGSIYFSLTTFATLGYGDLTYPAKNYILRLVSTSEAILGAVLMALFVVIAARKVIR